ncbi:TetR/AcrR family transcriptional regulator [Nocardioides jiangxiensis]|uniref:TetR/AcrR family transcriptional regulator C-terminal domain-containing protein n=1 Tax=Nocardioides jiangxiensis TaxID=3064524 RepID=A0ABT9B4A2_9ACTN|nr:TetR/AcrR family transcriptional regulator C-terminal domain-containing protein [Nocardioides sp. WY-20]MDO7868141.1 TetR/AcrR family transcriptional regulator C-terminal domain-containing protein [Nocardioides sp. WY-20]
MSPRESSPADRRRTPAGRGAARTRGRASHSLEQIVAAAIGILDRDGIRGLTLRGLAADLGGGLGSVYWYVGSKDELLALACDALLAEAIVRADAPAGEGPGEADSPPGIAPGGPPLGTDDPVVVAAARTLRRTALALFEQTHEHPWLALLLHAQGPPSPHLLRYWERLGRPLAEMGLTPRQQFHGSTAISGYVSGVAAEMAAQDLRADTSRSKEEQLAEVTDGWLDLDPVEFRWLHSIAEEFREHDDDEQFIAGLDLLLGGLVRQAVDQRH